MSTQSNTVVVISGISWQFGPYFLVGYGYVQGNGHIYGNPSLGWLNGAGSGYTAELGGGLKIYGRGQINTTYVHLSGHVSGKGYVYSEPSLLTT